MITTPPKSVADAEKLLALCELISTSAKTIINEWSETPVQTPAIKDGVSLPSYALFQAQRTIVSAAGMLKEVVCEPQTQLLEVSSQYFESRALHIAAEHRIPDILVGHDKDGLSVVEIGKRIGIEPKKLSRVLRALCSIHLFREVNQDTFANNSVTAALVGNEPLRAYIMIFALDIYSASDYLPKYLADPVKGSSYDVRTTAFQDALGTQKSRWEWLEEKIPVNAPYFNSKGYPHDVSVTGETTSDVNSITETKTRSRPEHELFGLAMLGGGRVFGTAHIFDYPWESLGKATVVDVGGGVGGFCLQLSREYPDLNFVVQDRPAVIEHTEKVWAKENPEALKTRAILQPHDFFNVNPVKNADIYWLRYIMHDWSDDYCVQILSGIRASMGHNSRILICDQVMNTTLGCPEIPPAPKPLPANYGYHTRYSHQRDLCMAAIINGIERTPAQFKNIIERAGLVVSRFIECRSQVSIVEVALPEEVQL